MRHALLIVGCLLAGPALAQAPATAPAAAPVPGFTAPPAAQSATAETHVEATSVETQKTGKMARDVFIGAYIQVDRACKVGAVPKVEFPTPPKNGKLRTRPDAMNLRQAPGIPRNKCLGVSPAGIAVIYRSNNRFKGDDSFVYTVTYPDGRIREVKGTVTVQ